MCFFVYRDHPTAKIAKKDITCYKVVRIKNIKGSNQYKKKYEIRSHIQRFIYNLDEKYKTNIKKRKISTKNNKFKTIIKKQRITTEN